VCLEVVECADAGVSVCAGKGGHWGECGKVRLVGDCGGGAGVSVISGACVAGDPGRGDRERWRARAWGVCA
jgi:hypothetical protein